MNKFRRICKSGYTLAEILIVLGIVGVVSAFMIPSIMTGVPSKYESLQKKAAYMLESTVSDIVNNEIYYERMDRIDIEHPEHITYTHGLANTYPVNIDGKVYGSYDNKIAAQQKFCRIFASKFKLKDGTGVNCTNKADFIVSKTDTNMTKDQNNKEKKEEPKPLTLANGPTFTSAEGIQWILPVSDFKKNTLILYKTSADYKSGPNCAYVSKEYFEEYVKPAMESGLSYNYIKTKKKECDRPDISVYVLTPGGKLFKEEATSDEVAERNSYKTQSNNQKPEPLTPKPNPFEKKAN